MVIRYFVVNKFNPSLAQSGSASALGAEGRRFESCNSDQVTFLLHNSFSEEHREKWIAAGRSTPDRMQKINATIAKRKTEIPGYDEDLKEKARNAASLSSRFTGKKHSEETKLKMRGPRMHLRLG